MPPEPQSVIVQGYTPSCALRAGLATSPSPPRPAPSAAHRHPHPLVFGSWLPEDFDTLTSNPPSPSSLPLSPIAAAAAQAPAIGVCAPSSGELAALGCTAAALVDGMDASAASTYAAAPVVVPLPQHVAPAASHAISALHLLMGANCSALLQHQLATTSHHNQLYLMPAALPMFSSQLVHFFSGVPGMLASNPAAWGDPHGSASAVPAVPYHNVPYPGPTGFWFHGLYFPSYEHFIAYRRRTIAYNFHYFGIRPYFRPPPDLPRPRPPAAAVAVAKPSQASGAHCAAPAAVPMVAAPPTLPLSVPSTVTTASGSTAAGGGGNGVPISSGGRAGKAYDDGESPCCSPGSTSTCSAGDSDDAASDVSPSDPDGDLLCDAQQLLTPVDLPDTCHGAVAVNAGSSSPSPAAVYARHLYDGGTRLVCAQRACTAVPIATSAASGGCGVLLNRDALSPVRCTAGNCDAGEEARQVVHAAGCNGGSPMAGVCPHWLERQFCALLDVVVGDALLGQEDAA